MATAWPQAGALMQNSGPVQPPPVVRRSTNPPPVCFNCGVEGHFLVACPEASRNVPGGLIPTPNQYQQYLAPRSQAQPYTPQGGPVQAQYPPYQPTPHYGPAVPQYPYNQTPPQQPYSAAPQYGRPGYQPPPYSQYTQSSGPPQYNSQGYQAPTPHFAPPVTASYHAPQAQFPPHNAGYGPNFQTQPKPFQPPQPQWNNPSAPRPAFQGPQLFQSPQRSMSGQQNFTGPPNQQLQKQRSMSLQVDHSSQATHQAPYQAQAPQICSSNPGNTKPGSRRASQASSIKANDSKASSRASTPYGNYGPAAVLVPVQTTHARQGENEAGNQEEGEVDETQVEEALFNWNFKHIFDELPGHETVALAQPLSAGFTSTPVPLIQAWSTDVPSVSRYARKDNLIEFTRPIRNLPHWSYMQEDPAFVSADEDGPSIPLDELPAWIVWHHEQISTPTMDEPTGKSRKRGRSQELDAEDFGDQEQSQIEDEVKWEVSSDNELQGPPIKRQKNEEDDEENHDEVMRTPPCSTPVIGRGTPVFETDDEAWAPQPGESASTPQDATEALLTSLGVEGSPKPIMKEAPPQYMNDLEEAPREPPQASQPPVSDRSNQPTPVSAHSNTRQASGPPLNGPYMNSQQPAPSHHGLPSNIPFANGQSGNTSYGNGPQGNFAPPNQQYGLSANPPFQNGPPQAGNMNSRPPPQRPYQGPPQQRPQDYTNSNPGYVAHAGAPYANGPPNSFPQHEQHVSAMNGQYDNGPHNNYAQQGPPQQMHPRQSPQQWGPPQNAPHPHGPAQGHPQYAPSTNAAYPSQPYGPPVNGPPMNGPQIAYGPAPYYQQGPQGQPCYGPERAPTPSNGPQMQGGYGAPSQSSPTYYGAPQNAPHNASQYPNGQPQPQSQNQHNHGPATQYGNGRPNNAPYQNNAPQHGPPNNIHFANGPPQQNHNGPNGSGPPRQDSGYMSARGSYSNGTAPQGFNNQSNSGNPNHIPQNDNMSGAGGNQNDYSHNDSSQEAAARSTEPEPGNGAVGDTGSDGPGTPLSPFSMEILGKLNGNNAKSPDSGGRDTAARKIKRPQPVVAEAYSRRW